MPTYAELGKELQWLAEFEAPAHAALNARLRTHYGHTRSQTGAKGDNQHLYGRHRSRNWCLQSRYCTDRRYGTTDLRDKAGHGDWLRATDLGVTGAEHRAVSRRLDAAVRAGRLPCVAEWFGSFDGRRVVGWFQGGPGTSDDSHLSHVHAGLWTRYCNDFPQMQLLGDVITGAKPGPAPPPTAPPAGLDGEDDMPRTIWFPHDGVNYWLSVGGRTRKPIRTPAEMAKVVAAYTDAVAYPAANQDHFPDTNLATLGWSRHDVDLIWGLSQAVEREQAYVGYVANYRTEAILAMRPIVTIPAYDDGDKTRPEVVEPNQLAVAVAQMRDRPGAPGAPLDVDTLRTVLLQLVAGPGVP